MVLPLTAAIWMFILFFFRVMQVESAVQQALYLAGRQTAAEASALSSESALLVSGEVLFRREAAEHSEIGSFVKGGAAGISLLTSDLSGEYVRLEARYRMDFPIGLFGKRGIHIAQRACCRKWMGRTAGGGSSGSDSGGYVYYTEYGSVYHTSPDCSYLNPSVHAAGAEALKALRNLSGEIYYPCAGCKASAQGTVYYTDYGTSYHSDLNCIGLKRTLHMLPKEEAVHMGYCSKCGH